MLKSSGLFLYENRRLTLSHRDCRLLKFLSNPVGALWTHAHEGDLNENAYVMVGSFVSNGLYFRSW